MVQHFLQAASKDEVDNLMKLYPQGLSAHALLCFTQLRPDPTRGSPYDMGMYGAGLTPQFKRLASILGDMAFQSLRRHILYERSEKQKTWSFCKSCDWSVLGVLFTVPSEQAMEGDRASRSGESWLSAYSPLGAALNVF
jgi:hypothetical protein